MEPRSIEHKKALFPEEVILKTPNFTVAQDWEVPILGFYIISSIQPRRTIVELSDAEIVELARLQRLIRACLETVFGISDAYFFQNEDSEFGFHIWIFPRHDWMDAVAGRKIQSVRPLMEYAIKNVNSEKISEIYKANSLMRKYLTHVPTQEYLSADLLDSRQDLKIAQLQNSSAPTPPYTPASVRCPSRRNT